MNLELSDDTALVLFDMLLRYGGNDNERSLDVARAAERNALWFLEAALERQLVAPFQKTYSEQVAAARARLEEEGGGW